MIIDQLPSLASVQATDEIPVERGETTYKATLQKLNDLFLSMRLINPANLADYGLSASGNVYNFTLSQLFSAIPIYSYVSIPWIKSQDTATFGTLAGELPTGTTDYGMLTLEKGASVGEFRFVRYSSSNVFHGSFTTVNSRGFNGWLEDRS